MQCVHYNKRSHKELLKINTETQDDQKPFPQQNQLLKLDTNQEQTLKYHIHEGFQNYQEAG